MYTMMWGPGFHHGLIGGGIWGLAGLLLHGLLTLVFCGALIVLAVFIVRAVSRSSAGQTMSTAPRAAEDHDHALAILKERYARGEITREQYEEMRGVLKS
jgi:putative membrane protein